MASCSRSWPHQGWPRDERSMSNRPPLELYIPAPNSRPGAEPDFGDLRLQQAGVARRPDGVSAEADMRDRPYGLIRVLDDEGKAVGAWTPSLQPQALRHALRAMVITRIFDDRLFNAHRQGKT